MPIRSTMKDDSFSSEHTWRKCIGSFVTEIIQHVECTVPMARVAEIAQTPRLTLGELAHGARAVPSAIIGGGGVYSYTSCSARRISFESDCFFGM